jgi:hypothetical protein
VLASGKHPPAHITGDGHSFGTPTVSLRAGFHRGSYLPYHRISGILRKHPCHTSPPSTPTCMVSLDQRSRRLLVDPGHTHSVNTIEHPRQIGFSQGHQQYSHTSMQYGQMRGSCATWSLFSLTLSRYPRPLTRETLPRNDTPRNPVKQRKSLFFAKKVFISTLV